MASEVDEGRPLRSDARRNRERIMDAAELLLAEHGGAVTMDDLARESGVGSGTLYRHFASKEDLLLTVLTARLWALVAEIEAVEDDDAHACLRRRLTTLFDGATRHRLLRETVGGELEGLPDQKQLRASMRSAIDSALTRAQEAGAVRPDVTVADLVTLIASLASPFESPGSDSRKHLAIALDGLRYTAPSG